MPQDQNRGDINARRRERRWRALAMIVGGAVALPAGPPVCFFLALALPPRSREVVPVRDDEKVKGSREDRDTPRAEPA